MHALKGIALAAATVALGGGLALAPAASAQDTGTTAHTITVAHTGAVSPDAWHTIWQSKFKPRSSRWVSNPFGVHAYNLTVKYQCWNGGDGTKARAKVVEADTPYNVVAQHDYAYCNGQWWSFNTTKVKPNTPYHVVIEQNHGRTHTEQVGAYEKY